MKRVIFVLMCVCLAVSMPSFADETIVYENDYEDQTPGAGFTEGGAWNWGTDYCAHTATYEDDGGNIVVQHLGAINNTTAEAQDCRFGSKWNLTMSGNTSSEPADYAIEFDLRSVSGDWDPIALEFYVLTTGGTQGYGSGAADYNQADGWVHVTMSLSDLTVPWWQGTDWDLTDSMWSIEVGGPPWPGTSVPAGQAWDQIWVMDNLKITQISAGTKSYNPDPQNNAARVSVDAIFSWTPGVNADKHDIYLGTVFNDVNDANRTNPMDVLVEQDYDANTYEPDNLQFNTTYYWRIDDVNDPNIYKGSIWRFTTSKEYIAEIIVYENDYEGETPGNGFPAWNWGTDYCDHTATYEDDGGNMVVQHLGDINNTTAEAQDCRFGSKWDIAMTGNISSDPNDYTIEFDLRSVSGDWDPINLEFYVLTYNPVEGTGTYGFGSGASAYTQANGWVHVTANLADLVVVWWEGTNWDLTNSTWSIEVGGPPWPGTSVPAGQAWDQIWVMDNLKITSLVPATSHDPYPQDVDIDVESNPVLGWTPGKYADKHDVYFGTDPNTVNDANRTNDPCGVLVSQNHNGNYYPISGTLDLDFNKTYYWRIDDVNDPNIYKGSVWRFTTDNHLAVEKFDDYSDTNDLESINNVWTVTGSDISLESTTVHSNPYSMQYNYTNDSGPPYYTEASANTSGPNSLDFGTDWTVKGVRALSLWFHGAQNLDGSFIDKGGNEYTIEADGLDIWDVADGFHYAYKTLAGPASITAKVESVENTDPWAKAGVMIRDTLEPGSKNVMIAMTPGNGVTMQFRDTTDGESTSVTDANFAVPRWVKLTFAYNESEGAYGFTTEHSSTGNEGDWTQLGDFVNLGDLHSSIYIGLCVTSHTESDMCTGEFSNVSTTDIAPGAVSGEWQSQDIGVQSNDPEPIYVVLQDSDSNAIVYYNDPNATLITSWTEWRIDLNDFTGVSRNDIQRIYVGVGERGNTTTAGGTGRLYIDDIRLYLPEFYLPEMPPWKPDIMRDGVIDYGDVSVIADNWLISGYNVTPVEINPLTDSDLVAYYQFEGNFDDSSTNGYDGEPNGATTVADPCRAVQVASFDGTNDYVALPIGSAIDTLTNSTFMSWVDFGGGDGSWQRIFDFGSDTNVYMFLTPSVGTGGVMRFAITTSSSGGEQQVSAPTTLASGWHHVAVTIDADNNTIRLYLDGYLVDENTNATLSPSDLGETTNNWLGRSQWEGDGYFMGSLDDFQIYNRALSHGEVAYLAGLTEEFTQPLYLLLTPQNPDINLYDDNIINFRDIAEVGKVWGEEQVWPIW